MSAHTQTHTVGQKFPIKMRQDIVREKNVHFFIHSHMLRESAEIYIYYAVRFVRSWLIYVSYLLETEHTSWLTETNKKRAFLCPSVPSDLTMNTHDNRVSIIHLNLNQSDIFGRICEEFVNHAGIRFNMNTNQTDVYASPRDIINKHSCLR